MTTTERPDRFLETERDIPITRPPAHPDRSVRGRPGKVTRPSSISAAASTSEPYGDVESGWHVFDNGICITCEGGA